jgi:hypothetical protein
MAATQQRQRQEGVIDPFFNEGGEGWLSDMGRMGGPAPIGAGPDWCRNGGLAYSGEISAEGKAEGRGTIRIKQYECTIRGAAFRNGAMLPCRAVFACPNGDAFAGPLAASGRLPADGARGTFVRGADGGLFEGTWPAGSCWFSPLRGAAWVRGDGSVHAVTLDGRTGIYTSGSGINFGRSGGLGWRPGGEGWVRLGVLTAAGPAAQVRRAAAVRAAPRGQWVVQTFPTVSNRF